MHRVKQQTTLADLLRQKSISRKMMKLSIKFTDRAAHVALREANVQGADGTHDGREREKERHNVMIHEHCLLLFLFLGKLWMQRTCRLSSRSYFQLKHFARTLRSLQKQEIIKRFLLSLPALNLIYRSCNINTNMATSK